MRNLCFLILVLAVALASPQVRAQESVGCLQSLARANDEFSAGRFFGIPSILSECLRNGFSNEQQVQAYLLLVQTYLILEDPIAAEDSYLKLLRADPEYVPSPDKDPIDVVYLSKKFTATPIFTPHLRVGGNTSLVRTIYEINTEPYAVNRKNGLKGGYQIGAGIDWNISDHLSIAGELDFSFRSYQTTKTGISALDEQTFTEKQFWFDVPVYIKYRDNFGKVRPFGYVGFALNLLVGAEGSIETINSTANEGQVPTVGPDEKLGYKRNFLNTSFLVGGGTYYKIGRDFLFVDVRYMGGLTNITKEETNYYAEGSELLTGTAARYRWVGDYFRLDNLSLSVGYVRPLYNPRKIKRKANTKKVMREISQDND